MAMQPGKMPSEAPTQPPAQGAAPQSEEAGEPTGSAQDLVVGINDLMGQLLAKMEGKADPQDLEQLQGVQQAFQGFVDAMGAPKAAPKGGAIPMEAGRANAKPVM